VRARTVLLGLHGFYGLYVMHGLFIQDTLALASLRDRFDECGMGPVLDHVIALNPSPRQSAENVAVCLGPPFDGLYELLMEQLTADPRRAVGTHVGVGPGGRPVQKVQSAGWRAGYLGTLGVSPKLYARLAGSI
jgi:hypothetical protein